MVALVFGQELVPLQELSEGWSANYGMWLRAAVMVGIVTHALLVQGMYLIDNFVVSVRQMLQLYVIMPMIMVGLSMIMSAYLVFPIPFYMLLAPPPFYVLLVVILRVVVGARAFRQMLAHRVQVGRCVRFVFAQTSTVFIFPFYEILFSAAQGTKYQFPVILLLPVIKVALKNLVLHYAKALEDMAPVEVIFTADFFNAIYVATCMHSSTSAAAISAIIVTDLLQTITTLYGLQRRTASILSRLRQAVDATKDSDNILTMMCSLCRDLEFVKTQSHQGIRKLSCLPLQISDVSKRLLDSLDEILPEPGAESLNTHEGSAIIRGPRVSNIPTQNTPSLSSIMASKHPSTIYPDGTNPPIPHKAPLSKKTPTSKHSASKNPTILLESLQTVFTTECILITAYLETFMPLFYSSYMMLMVQLPNVKYHLEMEGVTRENVVSSVVPLVIFGLLQFLSFAMSALLIRRNCGMEALYQLAFVLETQRSLIQCKMMLWMVITLCFRVTHFGTSKRFVWDIYSFLANDLSCRRRLQVGIH
ncbi:hypothetical protein PF006_g17588 [Phytophthora fragariae]|uniref:Uncharacterized protein n=1 Tax=Phytophthora fragariae TaxID=53985 RepID=A0A6A3T2C6_9STRA|nr:hypothetical protein PF006_g17588 [Phytophthora fragariae]